jgi:glycosyltransferase involved in cell wall biosynthesis
MRSFISEPPIARRDVEVDLLLETGGGGSARHVLDLYAGLRKLGWNAHLILSMRRADRAFSAEVAAIPGEHVTYIDMRRSPHLSDISAIAALRRRLAGSGKRHLLHAHSTKAGMLGWALGDAAAGKVFTPHAYRGMDPSLKWYKGGGIRRAETIFSRGYDKIIAVSRDEEKYIASLGVAGERILYVPNGVDVEAIRKRIAGGGLSGKERSAPVIGFVGRLAYQKNPMQFLEAFKTVVERGVAARAMVVGDGPLRAGLMEAAAGHNLSHLIEWRGETPAVDELGRVDVAVHTSRYESFPYTLLEAAAAQVPIVAVENSGSQAILGELLPEAIIPRATPAAVADAIIELLQNGAARTRHLAGLEAISRRFTIENMVRSTAAVYEEVLVRSGELPLA